MPTLLIGIIVGLIIIICFGLVYFIKSKQVNRRINDLRKEYNNLIIQYEEAKNNLEKTKEECNSNISKNFLIKTEIIEQQNKLDQIQNNINNQQEHFKALEEIYNKQANDKKEIIRQELTDSKNKQIEKMQQELIKYAEEIEKQKEKIIDAYNQEKNNFDSILEDYRSKRESIIKISKEEEEIRENARFYTLYISPEDIADIEILERVKPSLSRPDILSKLIYKTYYEKPYTDLVGRVIGNNKITGIYKITNLINNKVYIGQAVDIAERWRQHIKRAVGAEPMTTNKLYPIMKETGVYNFSWQIVEECKKEELTPKEKYWIQYYDGQGYGYNIKG